MSELRRASTSHSSVSSVVEFESFTETLLKQIRDAVDSTVRNVPLEEGQARCFLARSDLDSILHSRPLEQLFRDIRTNRTPATPRRHIQDVSEGERGGDINIDATIDRYIAMTTGIHSRTALLAMLIYQDREELLTLFLKWLDDYGDARSPSDDSMPFTNADLHRYRVPKKIWRSIIQDQAIFRPITIRQSEHRKFQTTDRLPFVGARTNIKNGSSGTVFHTTIAPRHWEIKSGDSYVSGNPTQPMVIALKTFSENPGFRDMQEATNDFEIERGILKEFRSSNVTHNMIMLDWGSFTIIDDHGHPTSHSLIFELATFSLADFLKDDRRAKLYKTKSLLLKKLVDVVEALACLHETFKTMHLDIKPDNILVFEKGLSHSDIQNEDQGGLIWKLSDFGLARKFGTNQRSGHNTVNSGDQPSRSSATLATRPAGVYQAPEIQERNSSQAGRGSDVWSIGCVALMIMAFVCGDPSEVFKLTNCLPVDFLGGGGCQNLFYVRSDSRPWKTNDVSHYKFEYLDNFSPDVGPIPNTQFKAAVNPRVIEWSNGLVGSYENQPEQDCIVQWFEVIFTSVLLISQRNRISAASLRDKLSEVQRNWRTHAVEASTNAEPQVTPPAPRTNIPEDLIREQKVVQPIVKRNILPHAINTVQDRSTAEPERRSAFPQHVRDIEIHQHNSHESREIVPRKTLGSVIKENDAGAVRAELDRDPGQLYHPCSGPNILPLHWAISNKAYLALDALLERCDRSITDQECRGRTALQLACTNSGDAKVLKRISKNHEKFNLPPEVYKENKKRLGAEARKALNELYSLKDRRDAREPREGSIKKKKFSFFGRS